MSDNETPKSKRPRGFAAMDREKVRAISKLGGIAAHAAGTAHEFDSSEAQEAGRKGGRAYHAKKRAAASQADLALTTDVVREDA
jgi:general stress protein YciG